MDKKWLALKKIIDGQAEDPGLWFEAETAPESYLQQELRKLHAEIEHAIHMEGEKPAAFTNESSGPNAYLISKGWLYRDAVYPYRDPWHKLSTYTLDDALKIQKERDRDGIDWGVCGSCGWVHDGDKLCTMGR
uniref:Uncharacterized protein n=1 Tax=viral metagenome TaxID=1070528 RepID=A0A6M3JS63_9ZZZZ